MFDVRKSLVTVLVHVACVSQVSCVSSVSGIEQEVLQQNSLDQFAAVTSPPRTVPSSHGAAAKFSEAAKAFTKDTNSNRTIAVSQCIRTVSNELLTYIASDGSDEYALPKLEIWCNVYNLRNAELRMRKQPAQAVLFNETKGLWKKVRSVVTTCVPTSFRDYYLLFLVCDLLGMQGSTRKNGRARVTKLATTIPS